VSDVLYRFDSLEAYLADWRARGEEIAAQRRREDELEAIARTTPVEYFCEIHSGTATFTNDGDGVNWREGLLCGQCHVNARVRFCLGLMSREAGPAASAYLTEQATFAYVAARGMFREVAGSEYVPDPVRAEMLGHYIREITGDATQELHHEDATSLSFPAARFDVVGSFEVLEHVPEFRKALREFARILVPGGTLVLTAPFLPHSAETLVRACAPDGSIEHLLEPEYHGNPVDDGGVLCFYHFGWDLLDELRAAGFSSA
jgi:SAM-dependent methyltransferase